ncbi:MAG: ABC-ATPase domain-containing protein [Gemmatimonadota bacterium]
MRTHEELRRALTALDGRSYKAYKSIEGEWSFGSFRISVDHVQGDPFAEPTRVRAFVPPDLARIAGNLRNNLPRARGIESLVARRFARIAEAESKPRGTGKSGQIFMTAPGQEVLRQTAVQLAPDGSIQARFTVGLPAYGRRIRGGAAAELLCEDVPATIWRALRGDEYRPEDLKAHADANEDADFLRDWLSELGLVAFVADGSILPRASGVSSLPLKTGRVVPFDSPPELRLTAEVPNRGRITGMGVPEGVTLVVGGGFHGKSTLLQALQWGIYNHRPGDGRELVVSSAATVKVRAEDGRAVSGVDISPFIVNLPLERDTRFFSTPNASGSTSQAAGILEAVESGASTLLVDEDTAATNFMIRDHRMQALVPKELEPITPFIDRVRQLYDELGVSSVIVVGGSGDYLDVADTVIAMEEYTPKLVTAKARQIASIFPTGRVSEVVGPIGRRRRRVPEAGSITARHGRRSSNIRLQGRSFFRFGADDIDLGAVEQLISTAQTRAIALGLLLASERFVDGERSVPEILSAVLEEMDRRGLDALDSRMVGDLAEFRRFELAAALNRLRSLRIVPPEPGQA